MRSHVHRVAGAVVLVLLAFPARGVSVVGTACAQTPATAPDPAFENAKRSWEQLAEADRRAIQEGLVWTGDYKGLVDGEFGRGTRSAIVAYAQRSGLPTDGTLDQRGRAMLAAAAAMSRNAVGFAPVRDPKSGAVLSLPTKLLPRRTETAQGSRWTSADSALVVETTVYPSSGGDLPAIFDALKDSTPQRKVTYRLLRPDFLVVSGEIGRSVFYTRIARSPGEQAGPLRGFTMTFPAGSKTFETLSIAITNGWLPFPPAPGTSPPPPGPGVAVPVPPTQARPAAGPVFAATGIVVAPDKVLTLYSQCRDPRIAGRPATVVKRDEDTGATLLLVAGLNGRPMAMSAATAAPDTQAIAVFLLRKGNSNDVEPAVAPGDVLGSTATSGRKRLLAPVQAEGQGGPVFDRGGSFIGLVGRGEGLRRVAGIVPQRAWPLVETQLVAGVLAAGAVTLAASPNAQVERQAPDIAAAARPSLLPVFCTP